MSQEPAAIVGSAGAIIGAVIVLLRSFGFSVSSAQEDAVKSLALILLPIVTGLVIRSFVVSPASAQTAVNEAHAAGKAGTPTPPSVKA